jgi:hypothetical protein
MKRFNRLRWTGVACAGLLAFIAVPKSQAQFTAITNGGGSVTTNQVTLATDPELSGAVSVATTGTTPYSTIEGATGIGGLYNETVYKQANGDLDFVLQVSNTNATTEHLLQATMSSFAVAGITSSVAYENITGLEPLGGPGNSPSTSAVEVGGVVNFSTSVASGSTSEAFIIQTNATTFTPGFLSFQDGATFSGVGFAPAALASAVPETGSLLCGLAVAAFAGFQLFRRKGGNGEMSGLAA